MILYAFFTRLTRAIVAVSVAILWAVIVLILYSIADLFGKRVVIRYGYKHAAAVVGLLSLVPFIVLYIALPQHITTYSIEVSAIAGVFYGIGFLALYKALVTEQTTNTFALTESFKAWLVLFGAFVAGSVLSLGKWGGVGLIFLGSFMVITTENMKINRKFAYALLGFVCWAILWTMMYYAIVNSKSYIPEGFIAAFFATLTAAIAAVTMPDKALEHRKGAAASKSGGSVWHAVVVGIAIGAGSLIFGYLIRDNMLSQGAAIIALTPIVVAIASKKIYLDRLTTVQVAGIAVAVAGALVLAFV